MDADSTQCLRDEHQVILRVLSCFEIALQQSRDTGKAAREVFAPFVEFFRGFADKCHHCKEEDRLFPLLEAGGIPREGGPIGMMLKEHTQGRARVTAIAENLDAADAADNAAIETLLQNGEAFLVLLRGHIDKEDNCLFDMAPQALNADNVTAILRAYQEEEATEEYKERFSRCKAIAERLMQTYGVS